MLAGLAGGFILARLFFCVERMIDYSLTGIAVILAVDMVRLLKGKKPGSRE